MGIFGRKSAEPATANEDDEQMAALKRAAELDRRGELTDDEFQRLSRLVFGTRDSDALA